MRGDADGYERRFPDPVDVIIQAPFFLILALYGLISLPIWYTGTKICQRVNRLRKNKKEANRKE